MAERVRSIDEVLSDLDAVAANFDRGWNATPPTMAALVRRIRREIASGLDQMRTTEREAAADVVETMYGEHTIARAIRERWDLQKALAKK